MKTLTILTPTYNRAHLLDRLYESLITQTDKNFQWVVVDDGSTDNTEEKVISWIKEKKLDIKYYGKKNGGKHTALNFGISHIETELTFVVDSDDFLTNTAVEIILKDYLEINTNEKIAGLSYLRLDANMNVIGKQYTQDGIIDSFTNQRINKNTFGDKAEVFKTEILKKFPFPEFEGENFLSESTVWCAMSGKYKFKFYNKGIYLCEYQKGGLSDNVHKRLFKNPKGSTECYLSMSSKQTKLLPRIKYTMAYTVYSLAAKVACREQFKRINSKIIYVLTFLPAWFIYLKKKRKFN